MPYKNPEDKRANAAKWLSVPENKVKHAARSKLWYEANTAKVLLAGRKLRLKKEYGITLEQLEVMKESQDYACAICGRRVSLHVDHSHKTGKVRALLCGNCNRGIGLFYDSPPLLRKAAQYLKGKAT